jgi:hypothetical protein
MAHETPDPTRQENHGEYSAGYIPNSKTAPAIVSSRYPTWRPASGRFTVRSLQTAAANQDTAQTSQATDIADSGVTKPSS